MESHTGTETFQSYIDQLPQSWYPVYISKKLKQGSLVPITMFNREWILFRSKCGRKVGFVERFCPHMGTDLANGSVKGCELECPLHHWKFGTSGKGNEEDGQSETLRLHTEEKYGLIFVFLGPKPLFDIPDPVGISTPIYSDPIHLTLDNDYLAVSLNSFDYRHLDYVHNRTVSSEASFSKEHPFHQGIELTVSIRLNRWIDYVMKFLGYSESRLKYEIWADNLAYVRNEKSKQNFLAILAPTTKMHHCSFFIIAARERWSSNPFISFAQRKILNAIAFFGKKFLEPDFPVIKNMHVKPGNLSKDLDKGAIKFWEHKETLPVFSDVKNEMSWE